MIGGLVSQPTYKWDIAPMRSTFANPARAATWAAAVATMTFGMPPGKCQGQHAIPFINDFSSAGFTNVTSEAWTYDDLTGVLNYSQPSGAGVVVGTASEEITGADASDFVMSTRFTLNDMQGALNPISVGFGFFGATSDFNVTGEGNAYYLADWSLGGSATGALRILRLQQGSSNLTIASGGNAGVGEIGKTYELRVTVTHNGGALDMTIAVFDDMGNQIGTDATGSHSTPLTGSYFGMRNRTAHGGHALNIDYHDFRIMGPAESQSADFDADGDVDGSDFLAWQRGLGVAGGLEQGDANGDGMVDGLDLDAWKSQFGVAAASASAGSIPEPSALLLALASTACLAVRHGGAKRRRRAWAQCDR